MFIYLYICTFIYDLYALFEWINNYIGKGMGVDVMILPKLAAEEDPAELRYLLIEICRKIYLNRFSININICISVCVYLYVWVLM